jgi:hypothetical protein
VPFFWSQHYDVPINYVGHAEKWDDLTIEGDVMAKDCLLRYKRNGRVLAVASIYRDVESLKANPGNFDYHHHAAIQTTQCGSMPFAFSTDAAAGAVSNFINALAASGSLELAAIPAAKMVYNCNSVGNGPRSSTPRTDTSSLA